MLDQLACRRDPSPQRPSGHAPRNSHGSTDCRRRKTASPKKRSAILRWPSSLCKPWALTCWYDVVRDVFMVGAHELSDAIVTAGGPGPGIAPGHADAVEDLVRRPSPISAINTGATSCVNGSMILPVWDGTTRLNRWLTRYAHAPNDAYSQDVSRLLVVSRWHAPSIPAVSIASWSSWKARRTPAKRSLSGHSPRRNGTESCRMAWMARKHICVSSGPGWPSSPSCPVSRRRKKPGSSPFSRSMRTPISPSFRISKSSTSVGRCLSSTLNPEGDNTYLRGQTGNTRYLPIGVHNIDLKGFDASRIQLFAEALAFYRAHPDDWWQLSSGGEGLAQEVREERRERSPYEDDLAAWLRQRGLAPVRHGDGAEGGAGHGFEDRRLVAPVAEVGVGELQVRARVPPPVSTTPRCTMRSASGKGRERNMMPSAMLNVVVATATPRPTHAMATRATSGLRRRLRVAWRMSASREFIWFTSA